MHFYFDYQQQCVKRNVMCGRNYYSCDTCFLGPITAVRSQWRSSDACIWKFLHKSCFVGVLFEIKQFDSY